QGRRLPGMRERLRNGCQRLRSVCRTLRCSLPKFGAKSGGRCSIAPEARGDSRKPMQHAPALWKVSAARADGHGIMALRPRGVSLFACEEAAVKTSIALVPLLSCACLFVTNVAFAQAKPADPWSSLKEDQQVEYNKRRLG